MPRGHYFNILAINYPKLNLRLYRLAEKGTTGEKICFITLLYFYFTLLPSFTFTFHQGGVGGPRTPALGRAWPEDQFYV